jgi:hypothetical protein
MDIRILRIRTILHPYDPVIHANIPSDVMEFRNRSASVPRRFLARPQASTSSAFALLGGEVTPRQRLMNNDL